MENQNISNDPNSPNKLPLGGSNPNPNSINNNKNPNPSPSPSSPIPQQPNPTPTPSNTNQPTPTPNNQTPQPNPSPSPSSPIPQQPNPTPNPSNTNQPTPTPNNQTPQPNPSPSNPNHQTNNSTPPSSPNNTPNQNHQTTSQNNSTPTQTHAVNSSSGQLPLRTPYSQNPQRPKPNFRPVKKKKGPAFGMGCLFIAVLLLVLTILGIVGLVLSGGGNSTIFGMSGADLVNTVKAVTTIFFLLISFGLLVLTVILIFKRTVIPVNDQASRKKSTRNIIFSSLLFLFSVFVWIIIYWLLSTINVQSGPIQWVTTDPPQPYQLTGPIEVKFNIDRVKSEARARNYQIISCEWDFDGNGDYRENKRDCNDPKYTYNQLGEFSPNLKINYESGKSDEFKSVTTISLDNLAPNPVLKSEPTSGSAPLTVKFDASESKDRNEPNSPLTYNWSFFEGDSLRPREGNENVTYTYDKAGDYIVTLEVVDQEGAPSITTQKITVNPIDETEVQADIYTTPPNLQGTVPLRVRFDGSRSESPYGNIELYSWDLGDGNSARGSTVTHTYREGGEYTVVLIVQDEKGYRDEESITFELENPGIIPVAQITTVPRFSENKSGKVIEGTVPFQVKFDASVSTDKDNNITTYTWDLDGDGEYGDAEGDIQKYIFEEEGQYNISVKVIDADNQSDTDEVIVIVDENKIRPSITTEPTPASGVVPFTVRFDASGSEYEDGNILSYEWDFGDGTQPLLGDAQVSHVYKLKGNYEVKVTIYTDDNQRASKKIPISVREPGLDPEITPSRKHGPAPLKVTFDPSNSVGSIKYYSWDFGDGETSTQIRPTHTFSEPGTYEVKLTITDNSNNIAETIYTIIVEEPY